MTGWKRAWKHVKKSSQQKGRKFLKRENHRANRRIGKQLETVQIKLSEYDVS
jgi:hypothetical protein